jgi:hypothetical protein
VSLLDYAYLDFIHGGDYKSFFSLRAGDRAWKSVPSLSGPARKTVELGPLPAGTDDICYSLGVP